LLEEEKNGKTLRSTSIPVVHAWCLLPNTHVCIGKEHGHFTKNGGEDAEAAKYDAFGPNHGGAFRPFDCGRIALVG
jgi:hypothetical protein